MQSRIKYLYENFSGHFFENFKVHILSSHIIAVFPQFRRHIGVDGIEVVFELVNIGVQNFLEKQYNTAYGSQVYPEFINFTDAKVL
jgi:hypothetical protein